MLAGKDFIRAGDGATCPKRWETIRVGKRVAGLSQRQKCDFYCCFISCEQFWSTKILSE